MKKILSTLILVCTILFLVSCDTVKSSVVISKLYTSDDQGNNVIELYNPGDKDINLNKHELYFYTNGSVEVSVKIKLVGTIESKGYFVIGSQEQAVSSVKPLIDFTFDGPLPFNGNDAIELRVSGKAHDLVGTIGMDLDFSRNQTLIRTGESSAFEADVTYNAYKFIGYKPDAFEYLKNDTYAIKTVEQLLEGPKLEARYLEELPYVSLTNNTVGAGGTAVVKLQSIADGDTAFFTAENGYPGGSMRYFYIDTPEVDGPNVKAGPWGYVASKYNKEFLLNDATSKEIMVQSIPEYSIQEGYGRNLGLVWINGHLSQFLIVKEGLSDSVPMTYFNYDLLLTYKDVPYLTFLKFAEQYARSNGWGMHGYPNNPEGEKSPDWNYQAFNGVGGLATTTPMWTPHNPLPW